MDPETEEEKKVAQAEPELKDDGEVEEPEKKKKKRKKKNKNKDNEEDEHLASLAEAAEETKKPIEEEAKAGEDKNDDDEDDASGDEGDGAEKKKKKKKKKSKYDGYLTLIDKKKAGPRDQDNSELRLLGDWKAQDGNEIKWKQNAEFTVPVRKQFEDNVFPEGEWMDYTADYNRNRITDAEFRDRDRLHHSKVNDLRKAAECHRQVRKYAQQWMRPGMRLTDICQRIEAKNLELVEKAGLEAGIAFPTGCSINDCAAHFTPNPGDEHMILGKDDVMKIDYGTQVNGHIIDCAFTVAFNPVYDPLLLAVKEATNQGIKSAGIGARLGEIGADIQEVMESHELTLGNKTYPVRCVENLCGHSIAPYLIHAGKSVPIVKRADDTKMEEGELFAIETFGVAAGRGSVFNAPNCSHYMMKPPDEVARCTVRNGVANACLKEIANRFGTLAFCRRWLDETFKKHLMPLNLLVKAGVVGDYPPLNDIPGSYVAQYEHTIFLHPTRKEVLSRGDDY